MTTTFIRPSSHLARRVALSVDVVDGMGVEVPGQPVTADFIWRDGSTESITAVTDAGGRARFLPADLAGAHSVIVHSGTESSGLLRTGPGTVLVLEM